MFIDYNSNIQELGKSTRKTIAYDTAVGKNVTNVTSAKNELYKLPAIFNPLDLLKDDRLYFGLDFVGQEEIIYLSKEDVTHAIFCGATRTGKGVLAAAKIVESIRAKRGVVIFDPKQDDYMPQVVKEELERQNRPDDLLIVNFPLNYNYSGFEESDTVDDFTNKLTAMLDLFDVDNNPGASYYRRNQRVLLEKVVSLFFKSEEFFDVKFEKNFKSLINFTKYLYQDLENETLYFKEISKQRTNAELLDRHAKRYFNPKLFELIELFEQDLEGVKGLFQTLKEFENINISTEISVKEALINGKIIYVKSDMLDSRALKLLKLFINDIIIQAKKLRNCSCDVFCDEVSFYPTPTLAGALATIAGWGVHFTLMYQSSSQLAIASESLKKAIESNCQLKVFYKTSDIDTLDFIEKIGGVELVTKVAKSGSDVTIRQDTESLFNITRLRAIPRNFVAVLISESLAEPRFIQSSPIPVRHKFNWEIENSIVKEVNFTKLTREYSILNKNEIPKKITEEEAKKEESAKVDDVFKSMMSTLRNGGTLEDLANAKVSQEVLIKEEDSEETIEEDF